MDFARGVIERALGPERAAELLGRLASASETRPFEFLRRVPPERIAVLLRGESPQTVALVLASLHDESRGRGARAPARGRAARYRAADRAHGPRRHTRDPAGRAGHPPQAGRDGRAQVLRQRRRQDARRDPQSRRPHHRAQRAREPCRHGQDAGRGGARHAVRVRGHRQARRACDPASAARGRPEGSRAGAARCA